MILFSDWPVAVVRPDFHTASALWKSGQSGPVPAGLTGSIQAEVEFVLTVVESLSGSLHQDREFTLIVG